MGERLTASQSPRRELRRELGVSYLVIASSIAVVEYIVGQVPLMRTGCIVDDGPCAFALNRPGDNHTRSLLAAVPSLSASAQRRRQCGQMLACRDQRANACAARGKSPAAFCARYAP